MSIEWKHKDKKHRSLEQRANLNLVARERATIVIGGTPMTVSHLCPERSVRASR
jgi:hypothetical protein